MSKRAWKGCLILFALFPTPVFGGTEVTPFAGYRFADNVQLQTNGATTSDELHFNSGASFGVLVNADLDQPGKQYQLYYAHQVTRASVAQPADFAGLGHFDVVIDRLQFGGLYFPGGQGQGAFVDGTLGVSRLSPRSPDLETEYYPSIALGGGVEIPVNRHFLLRFDLRGLYTALNTGGTIFCSGGCIARVDSKGFFQLEAAVGTTFRF